MMKRPSGEIITFLVVTCLLSSVFTFFSTPLSFVTAVAPLEASPSQSLDAWDSLLPSFDFPSVIESSDLEPDSDTDWDDPATLKHIMSTSAPVGPPSSLTLTSTNLTLSQCTPTAVSVSGIQFVDVNNATLGKLDVEIVLLGPTTLNGGNFGTLTIQNTQGITFMNGSTGVNDNGTIYFLATSITTANTALASLIYTPPLGLQGTANLVMIEVSGQASTDSSQVAFSYSPLNFTENLNYNPLVIVPIDGQSFTNLTTAVNTTVTIPPIFVSSLGNPDDELSVQILSESGVVTLLSTTGLIFSSSINSQLITFVGTLADVNNALAHINFTAKCLSNDVCGQTFHAGFNVLVRDFVNNTECPNTALFDCGLSVLNNNQQIIQGAVPAPTVVVLGPNSVNITFGDITDIIPAALLPSPVVAYGVELSTNPNTIGFTEVYKGFGYTFVKDYQIYHTVTIGNLTSSTTYTAEIYIYSEAGLTVCPTDPNCQPIPVQFTTSGDIPGSITISISSSSSSSISFNVQPPNNTEVNAVVANISSSKGVQGNLLIVPVTIAGENIVEVVTGLDAFTEYSIDVQARNNFGMGPVSSVHVTTMLSGPVIVGFVASDPTNSHNSVSDGDLITITFNEDTNQPPATTQAQLNALFQFSSPLADVYTGQWMDANTLEITLGSVGNNSPQIGVLTVSIIGTIYNAAESSDKASANLPYVLTGNWGLSGLSGYFVQPTSQVTVEENGQTYTGVTLNFNSTELADLTSSYVLSVQVLSPVLNGVSLAGKNFSSAGLSITTTSSAAQLTSLLPSVLLTAPRDYFGSVSLQFSLTQTVAGVSQIIGELVSVILVTHPNHAPVITAPASVNLVLEQTVNVGQYIAISDVDVPVGSLTDFASMTVSASSSGLLSYSGSTQEGVHYAPGFNGLYPAVQLSGPLYVVQMALQNLEVNFEYSSATFGSPAQYFLTMSLNDHSNGGQPILTTSQLMSVQLSCPNDLSQVQSATFSSAVLSANGNQVYFTSSLPVSDTVLIAPYVSCSTFFEDVSSFGKDPLCHWLSNTELEADLGVGATLTLGTSLTTKSNSMPRCGSQMVTKSISKVLTVEPGSSIYLSPVSIIGPQLGSLCEDLTLFALTGASSAHGLSYQWTLPTLLYAKGTSDVVSQLDLTQSSVTIPATVFSAFTPLPPSFTFVLQVSNFLNQSRSASMDVVFNKDAKPLILPMSAMTIYTTVVEPLSILASATVPTCTAAPLSGASGLSVVYSWTVSPPIADLMLGSAPSLSLPASALLYNVPSHAYTFTLQAALSSNPNMYATQTFTVVLSATPLEAVIAGGAMVSIDANQYVVLDASGSYDADATSNTLPSEYSWSWSCVSSAPSGANAGACYSTDGNLLLLSNEPSFNISAGSLYPNAYTFSIVWTHLSTGRVASATQIVYVSDIVAEASALFIESVQSTINSGDKLSLRAVANLPSTFTWSILGSGSTGKSISLSNAVNSSSTTSDLILNPQQAFGFFEAGATYGLMVQAVNSQGEVIMATSSFYVNAAPSCSQSLSLSSSSGIALSTMFTMTMPASTCFDSDSLQDDPLIYRFFRVDPVTGLYLWLSAASSESSVSQVLLPVGNSVMVGVRVSDSQGGFSEYTQMLSLNSPALSTPNQYQLGYKASIEEASQVQDAVTVTSYTGSYLSSVLSSSLAAQDIMNLKDNFLTELLALAAASSDDAVTPVLALLVNDASSTSASAANFSLQWIDAIGNGAATSNQLPAVLSILDGALGVIANGQGSSSSGGGRRLLSSPLATATLDSLNTQLLEAFTAVSADVSSDLLTVAGDYVPLSGQRLSGLIQRGAPDFTSFDLQGNTVQVPAGSISSTYDVALISTPSTDFSYLALSGQVSPVIYFGIFKPSISTHSASRGAPSAAVSPLPSGVNSTITLALSYNSAQAGTCLNSIDLVTGALCSLECRRWNGTGFDTQGVTTNFNALNNVTRTALCEVSQPGAFALFRATEFGIHLSSTGSQGSTGASSSGGIQANAVRASVSFPAPFVVVNSADFKSGLVIDLSAVTGQPILRFNVEQVTTNSLTGTTTVIIDIWDPTSDTQASSQDVYSELAGLTINDVLSTTYLKNADLSSWQEQCPDMVFRPSCSSDSSTASSTAWQVPLIASAAAAGFLLLCVAASYTVYRLYKPSKKDDKSVDDGFNLPVGQLQAKQYIYSAPVSGKELDNEISREAVSDVTIVASTAGIDPHSQTLEEDILEPVLVESEQEAAELAKNPDLMLAQQRAGAGLDQIAEDGEYEYSRNSQSASVSGQSRHFYYVDDSRVEQSRSRTPTVVSKTANSHFRISGNGTGEAPEVSYSRSASQSIASSRGPAAHFRYSDNEDGPSVSRTPSLPSLNDNGGHSPSQSVVEAPASFQTLSHLELEPHNAYQTPVVSANIPKRAVRVVRPGATLQ